MHKALAIFQARLDEGERSAARDIGLRPCRTYVVWGWVTVVDATSVSVERGTVTYREEVAENAYC